MWEPEQPKPKHPSVLIREDREAEVKAAMLDGRGRLIHEYLTPSNRIARRWENGVLTITELPSGSDTRSDQNFWTR